MRLREIVVVLGAFTFAWAQIESPNSFVGLSVGASAPAGNTASRSLTYPSHGYMRAGGALGLHLNAFIAPYVGLSLRFSQSFLSLDAKALEKRGALFPEPVSISKNPTISHTLVGVGASTGFRWEWISLYVPLQLAIGVYSAPEIQGVKSATQLWVQPKFSTVQLGVSTGLIANFAITDDFFAGLSILYTGVGSGEKEFERFRYDFSVQTLRSVYRESVNTSLSEVGVIVGLNF